MMIRMNATRTGMFSAAAIVALMALSCQKPELAGLTITSPAFKDGKFIPAKYTCLGNNVNPELNINGLPAGTKSLILFMDDVDAPVPPFVHWVVYDIPAISTIKENSVPGKLGINSESGTAYIGPCPGHGSEHRYLFRLFALDITLGIEGANRYQVEKAMEGHILGRARLLGRFKM